MHPSRDGGGTDLTLALVVIALTTNSFRDGAPILLQIGEGASGSVKSDRTGELVRREIHVCRGRFACVLIVKSGQAFRFNDDPLKRRLYHRRALLLRGGHSK